MPLASLPAPALRRSLALLLFIAFAVGAQAQDLQALSGHAAEILTPDTHFHDANGQLQPGVRCAVPHATDEELSSLHAATEAFLARQGGQVQSRGVTVVPVAIHVLRSGTAVSQGNITDQMIANQIAYMNDAWAGSNFQFTLATTTRTTNTTWYNGCYPSTGSTAVAMKNALAVDPARTFNLYSCNPSSGILGEAVFPWSYPESDKRHGVIVLHSSFPGGTAAPYNLGGTAAHEAGHYFGLWHTFQGGCGGGDNPPGCTTGGDQVCDTGAQASPTFGCPSSRNSCTGGLPDPIHNYMDYSDDICYTELTAGQGTRMDQMIAQYRPSLLSGSQGTAQVAITRLSGATVAASGGPMQFRLTFTNTSGATFNGEYWVQAQLPVGGTRLVFGPTAITVNNGATQQVTLTGNVPGNAPAGLYTVTGYVGHYPSDVDDSDAFTFTKAASLTGEEPTGEAAFTVVNEATGVSQTAPLTAEATEQPAAARLVGAYPNPFDATSTIAFELGAASEVEVTVYNSLGQRVAVLAEGALEAGRHTATFDGSALPSGVYLYRLQSGAEVQTGRLLLVK